MRVHAGFVSITLLITGLACLVFALTIGILALKPGMALHLAQVYDNRIKSIPGVTSFDLVIAAVLVIAAIVIFYGTRLSFIARRPFASLIILLASIFLFSLTVDLVALPVLNYFKSAKSFYENSAPYIEQAEKLYMFPDHMHGLYNLYTGRVSIPVLEAKEELLTALNGSSRVVVIAKASSIDSINPLLMEKYSFAAQGRIGHRDMVLITNWIANHSDLKHY